MWEPLCRLTEEAMGGVGVGLDTTLRFWSSFSVYLCCPLPLWGKFRGPEAVGYKVELVFHFL